MDEKAFGERIAALRAERRATQVQLADAIGVSDKTVSKWETGGGLPDIQFIPSLAKYFGVTTDYLFGSVHKEQKLFIRPPYSQNEGKENRKLEQIVNEDYLSRGWRVASLSMAGEEEYTLIVLLLERDILQ